MTLGDLKDINKDIITVTEAEKMYKDGFSVICGDGKAIDFDIDVSRKVI